MFNAYPQRTFVLMPNETNHRRANAQNRVESICRYIDAHLDETLTVNILCERAKLSKYHFHRIFCAHKGINIAKYILLARLKRASFQLAFQPKLKIIDIALKAGFESPEAFSRSFKRHFDQSPSEFRNSPDWPNWHQQYIHPTYEAVSMTPITIRTIEPEKIAYISHLGDPKKVLESAGQFIKWRKSTGFSPIKTSRTYGVPWSDPESTGEDSFRFDICGSVDKEIPDNDFGVKNGVIPGGKCAVISHKGSHDAIKNSVHFLYKDWLPDSGEETRDFPVYFHYLNFIHEVDECDLLTDIYLPLK